MAESLAAGEACKAIFLPTPGFNRKKIFDSFWFSAEGTLNSAVPHRRMAIHSWKGGKSTNRKTNCTKTPEIDGASGSDERHVACWSIGRTNTALLSGSSKPSQHAVNTQSIGGQHGVQTSLADGCRDRTLLSHPLGKCQCHSSMPSSLRASPQIMQ